jgi:hypothetical protein
MIAKFLNNKVDEKYLAGISSNLTALPIYKKMNNATCFFSDPFWILHISNSVSQLHVVINGIFTDDSFKSSIFNKKKSNVSADAIRNLFLISLKQKIRN